MENIIRASHLNVTKNLVTSTGPQLLLQTALYARIGTRPTHMDFFPDQALTPTGVTHLSWLSSEIFRECYANKSPFEDYLKSTFRSCQLVCQLFPS